MNLGLQGFGYGFQLRQGEDALGHLRHQRVGVVEARLGHQPVQQNAVFGRFHGDFQHEAVPRRRRQLEGFFLLHPVAVGEHLHMGEAVLPVEGRHAFFGHDLQQQGVDLRPGAVDFVEEKRAEVFPVLQQRPRQDAGLGVLVQVGVIHQVMGHQIDRAFDAGIAPAHAPGRGPQQGGLAHAHAPFQQDVAAGKNRGGQQADGPLLAEDGFPQPGLEAQGQFAVVAQCAVVVHAKFV